MATAHEQLALELSRVFPDDTGRVGMKAANQASLAQAGFRVPEGVILTTDAYLKYSSSAVGNDPEFKVSPKSRSGLRLLLEELVKTLGDSPLAVRSSGVAEDLPEASFAGLYETVLGVRGLDSLEEAVLRCWASAAALHATTYRDVHGISARAMAVLIQEMVPAEAAGVAFSANPVTGDRHEVVINAIRGLGDRLVSGLASPDEWTVRDGDAHCERSPEDAITAQQARQIAELTRRVEAHFDSPQDIEWAIAAEDVYLLQARPITALPDPPVTPIPIELIVPDGFWMYDASHNPRPGYHMDLVMFPMIRRSSRRWAAEFGYLFDGVEWTEVGMWPYQRIVPLGGREGPMPPRWLMRLLVRVVPLLRGRVQQAIEVVRLDAPSRYVQRWYQEWQPGLDAAVRDRIEVDLDELTDTELVDHVESTRELLEQGIYIHMVLHGALSMILYELSTVCGELLGWDLTWTMDLVSGTSYKSTEPARRLHDIAQMAASRPTVARLLEIPEHLKADMLASIDGEFARVFSEHLDQYGHRALGYTLGEPTLAEMPEILLDLIRAQIQRNYDPAVKAQENEETRAATAAQARAQLAGRPEDLSRFEQALEKAERAYPVREDNEFFTMSAPLAVLRYAMLEIGRRLAERGVIDKAADVMHLELEQALTALHHGGDHHRLVALRKGHRAWAELNPGPPFYGNPPPRPPSFDFLPSNARLPMEAVLWNNEVIMAVSGAQQSDAADRSSLSGIAASSGRYTGPARVVMDETQFEKLRPGDVLVCPITSPVWSVLFPIIGALVTDTGGVLSHPAIIAREYGIPAVVACGAATARLRDGELVTVDGTTGTVEPETPTMTTQHIPLQKEDKS